LAQSRAAGPEAGPETGRDTGRATGDPTRATTSGRRRIVDHLRGNAVGYVALFAALGGTSYAAVALPAGSVHSIQLANGAVTHAKLARSSVGENDLAKRSLTAADFKPGALVKALVGPGQGRASGKPGAGGAPGRTGATGPAGRDGSASIVMRARGNGTVTAPNGASTNVPLSGATWTQAAGDLNLITGSVDIGIPGTCTGSFGNALTISIDGVPNTFAVAPTAPASATATIPFAVSEVMEPGSSRQHTATAKLGNSCTKSGESYQVSNVRMDVLSFH
jgi:hypothetical protein